MFLSNIRKGFWTKLTKLIINTNYTSKHLPNDILLLRHAQSFYNVASAQYCKKNNIKNISWDQICQIEDFNLDINYNKKFIDCDLSQTGALQCYDAKAKFQGLEFEYDLILVSPLLRALRTCRYVFNYFPIKKIVLPQLIEVFRYSCDVSLDIEVKKQQFKQFDFSKIKQNNKLWFLDNQSERTQQIILKFIKQKQLHTYPQIQHEILMLMYQKKVYQTDYQLRMRCNKVKKIIEAYKKDYNKIIVISHHYMIQNLLAKGYRTNNQPITSISDEVPNATPITATLDTLLTIS